ncbi:hypothetical protein [Billgrantia endophytica]|uniref:Uncharacterized protein n=1 Tax=Billgrantia endophytica TaxID=2033802 RepID=A0A2N7TUC0_9GAMM|nr:hypothetical protein [Halomonas endophytica]PMR71777.1 hypothetical protein C1H69_22860 [Halomonas endophytica]
MKGKFNEFENKQIEAGLAKRFFQRRKRMIVANLVGKPEYRETQVLSNMTSIILSLIELEDKYERYKINQLDSIMDVLSNNDPEFYQVSGEIFKLTAKSNDLQKDIFSKKKYGCIPDDLIGRKDVINFKLNALKEVQKRVYNKSNEGN